MCMSRFQVYHRDSTEFISTRQEAVKTLRSNLPVPISTRQTSSMGGLNPQGMHVGDLENIHVSGDGTGTLQQTIKRATLAPGENSLLREGGTSIVFHAAQMI